MEATTYQTAALIDRGAEDYMLETAILKVFSTEALWQGVYETLQVYGGQGYFSDEPYERMMRDARINTIGEGANEVLKAFIALVGMREIGKGLKSTLEGLKRPGTFLPTFWSFTRDHLGKDGETCRRSPSPAHAAADGPGPVSPGRAVRPYGRAAADRATARPCSSAIHPGADRRRGHRAGDLGLHALAMGPLRIARAGRRPPSDRPPSCICGWPTAASTSRCAPCIPTTTA